MKPTNVKRIAVHVLVVFALAVVGVSFADTGTPPRPGGGFAEPIVLRPLGLDSFGMPTGGGFPYYIAPF
jgi:hypothetical protein